MVKAHAEALEQKRQALHARIDSEEHRVQPDESLIARLKREKLRLKDQLVGH